MRLLGFSMIQEKRVERYKQCKKEQTLQNKTKQNNNNNKNNNNNNNK